MSSRSFRLESVLRLRKHELDRAGAELGNALRSLTSAQTRQRECELAVQLGQRLLEEWVGSGTPAGRLRSASRGVGRLAEAGRRAGDGVQRAAEAVRRARTSLVEARRRVRALERLRERRDREERARSERVAQRRLDEIGVQMATRSNPS